MTLPLAPPAGMRDLLHPESTARRAMAERVGRTFAGWGYDLVTTPAFEHADVLERGLSTLDRRDLVRFVEPETGEVALLRPDITPQIARIVATRLRDRPPPIRLRYQGTVIRRRRGRARRHRQIAQAGVECIGLPGAEADVEMVAMAAQACEAVALDGFRIELRQVRIGHAALSALPEELREEAAAALARKDRAALSALLTGRVGEAERTLLTELTGLYGDVEVLHAARSLATRHAWLEEALAELADVVEGARAAGLSDRIGIDLGELRGMSYYTGVSFVVLAAGPGEPVGAGGRYDNLLERFEAPAAATGFAIDLDNLEWALTHAGRPFSADLPLRVVLQGEPGAAAQAAELLRQAGVCVASVPGEADPLAFARSWGYDCALDTAPAGLSARRIRDGAERTIDPRTPDWIRALADWAREGDRSRNED